MAIREIERFKSYLVDYFTVSFYTSKEDDSLRFISLYESKFSELECNLDYIFKDEIRSIPYLEKAISLAKEAKKKGFKNIGDFLIRSARTGKIMNDLKFETVNNELIYYPTTDALTLDDVTIYHKGNWNSFLIRKQIQE